MIWVADSPARITPVAAISLTRIACTAGATVTGLMMGRRSITTTHPPRVPPTAVIRLLVTPVLARDNNRTSPDPSDSSVATHNGAHVPVSVLHASAVHHPAVNGDGAASADTASVDWVRAAWLDALAVVTAVNSPTYQGLGADQVSGSPGLPYLPLHILMHNGGANADLETNKDSVDQAQSLPVTTLPDLSE